MTPMTTRRCIHCGHYGLLNVPLDGYQKFLRGAHVQDAFPQMSAGLREQIITGTHPECWDAMFAGLEDE